ncbi:hypothetical protein AB0F03_03890 [Streptomyces sp. NPDC028722]|uniref:hypothetical protein n=1 Tax=Streptomyces sp. NPDC028722 TaxID=3155016 RepID=UPI0033C5C6A8
MSPGFGGGIRPARTPHSQALGRVLLDRTATAYDVLEGSSPARRTLTRPTTAGCSW